MSGYFSNRILFWHSITDTPEAIYKKGITAKQFQHQLRLLASIGFRFVKLSEVIRAKQNYPSKSVSITTDDGFASTFAVLKQTMFTYGFKPTLFLIGKCIDNRALAWNHKLILLKSKVHADKLNRIIDDFVPGASSTNIFASMPMQRKEEITDALWMQTMPFSQEEYLQQHKPFLAMDQMHELYEMGAEFAIHSYSHPDFSRLELSEAIDEIQKTMDIFDSLGINYQRLFAYPYGRTCNPDVEGVIMHKLNLDACFGVRYTYGDNEAGKSCWQRQGMESTLINNLSELCLIPMLRVCERYLKM
jgi:peptidoglycan/xylan/chitin deacetylase (PgdA/CDA1 family)